MIHSYSLLCNCLSLGFLVTCFTRKHTYSYISKISFKSSNQMIIPTGYKLSELKRWSSSLHTTTCSGKQDPNFWIYRKKRRENPVKLQCVKLKRFHLQGMWHKFRVFTVYRSSTLVRALAHPQQYWGRLSLRCNHVCKSWGKHELHHSRRLSNQVGSQNQVFVHCNFKAVNRNKV